MIPNELKIFSQAIRFDSRDERGEYLGRVCGDNQELRARIDALLEEHERSGEFLDVPALEQIASQEKWSAIPPETILGYSREQASGETDFLRYLEPATRSGWLGRLAHYEIEKILGRGAFWHRRQSVR